MRDEKEDGVQVEERLEEEETTTYEMRNIDIDFTFLPKTAHIKYNQAN